jgi:biopolymer transport protein ExbD
LPEADTAETVDKQQDIIEVGVNEQGNYFVNQEELLKSDADTLRQMLIKASRARKDLPVIISADGKAPHQSVITVLDVASQLGMTQMTFATQQTSKQN